MKEEHSIKEAREAVVKVFEVIKNGKAKRNTFLYRHWEILHMSMAVIGVWNGFALMGNEGTFIRILAFFQFFVAGYSFSTALAGNVIQKQDKLLDMVMEHDANQMADFLDLLEKSKPKKDDKT